MSETELQMQRAAALRSNQRCYDALVDARAPLCRPASDAEIADPLRTVDPLGWLGPSIEGRSVLCLAAGGGRQSVLYASAGANVTVVDISPAMLELDRAAARERRLPIRAIQGSMDELDMLSADQFDIVIHPVSTCYLPDVAPVFRAVARVLRPAGLYISQHKSPTSLQASCTADRESRYVVEHPYYRTRPVPPPTAGSVAQRIREPHATEYLHRWEQLIGGICRAGMQIEDFIEPDHADNEAVAGTFGHRAMFIAPYVRIKARKRLSHTTRPGILLTP